MKIKYTFYTMIIMNNSADKKKLEPYQVILGIKNLKLELKIIISWICKKNIGFQCRARTKLNIKSH